MIQAVCKYSIGANFKVEFEYVVILNVRIKVIQLLNRHGVKSKRGLFEESLGFKGPLSTCGNQVNSFL